MSTMVSARVPSEIRDQGLAQLASIGACTSDLIISAFVYVAKTGKLPTVPEENTRMHDISASQLADIGAKLSASSLKIALPENWNYREELACDLEEGYEALD